MTAENYILRVIIFLVIFSIPTVGLMVSFSGSDQASANWLSYFLTVGTMMFCGVFSVGRANRYLLITFAAIICMNYLLIMYMDSMLPLSGYLRILMFPLSAYLSYLMLVYRNVLTMNLNRVKKSDEGLFKDILNKVFKRDLPTRETNFSLVMMWYVKVFLAIDLGFVFVSYIYYIVIGMGFHEMYNTYLATGMYYNFPLLRDFIVFIVEVLMTISMIVHVLYDGKRPDTLGVGNTAIYDRSLIDRYHSK